METATEERPTRRGRRALPLIVLALVAIAAASFAYLRPTLSITPQPAPPAASPAVLASLAFDVTYDFVTPSMGWALEVSRQTGPSVSPGEFWVFRTLDGAKHWQQQVSGQSPYPGSTSLSVQFVDQTHGLIAVGIPLELFRTADGGAHWDPVGLPASSVGSITFTDPLHGWLLSFLGGDPQTVLLFATGDGGDTWQHLPDPPSPFIGNKSSSFGGITFRSPTDGWMGGSSTVEPAVYSSGDGGRTWQRHLLPLPATTVPIPTSGNGQGVGSFSTAVHLLPGAGVIASVSSPYGDEYVFTSLDGGTTWTRVGPPPGNVTYADLRYQDTIHWWGMRFGTLYKSSDAGQTWTRVSQQLDDWDYVPQIIDAKHAWAKLIPPIAPRNALPQGTGFAMTADGGLHWTQFAVPLPG